MLAWNAFKMKSSQLSVVAKTKCCCLVYHKNEPQNVSSHYSARVTFKRHLLYPHIDIYSEVHILIGAIFNFCRGGFNLSLFLPVVFEQTRKKEWLSVVLQALF
jgi:hypothetical protein